jgi:hypothetical protein
LPGQDRPHDDRDEDDAAKGDEVRNTHGTARFGGIFGYL